jgi:hypothetical protein
VREQIKMTEGPVGEKVVAYLLDKRDMALVAWLAERDRLAPGGKLVLRDYVEESGLGKEQRKMLARARRSIS